MFKANYVFDNSKCMVHVALGEELDYNELLAIRKKVQQLCDGCQRYIAIYDYTQKPRMNNFSLTTYRKLNASRLDIIINFGMNTVQRSFTKLVHTIKPSSREIHFVDSYEEAIALAKTLLPNQFPNGDSASRKA